MSILNIIVVVLIVFWVGGSLLHIAGDLIHLVLVVALVVFALRFFKKTVK